MLKPQSNEPKQITEERIVKKLQGTPGGFAPGVNSAAQPGYMRHAHKGVVCLATCLALHIGGQTEYLTLPPFSQTMPPKLPPCIPGTWHTLLDAIARHKAGFQRGKEKGRKVLNLIGLGSGARSHTHTKAANPHKRLMLSLRWRKMPPIVPPNCEGYPHEADRCADTQPDHPRQIL
jgi:hypothetical protein